MALTQEEINAIADAVWDEAMDDHFSVGGSFAQRIYQIYSGDCDGLSDAIATNVWSVSLPGAYIAGTAGYAVGVVHTLVQVRNTTN